MTDGARNVAVPVVCSLERVPKELSDGHAVGAEVTGVLEVLLVVVVV
jgi:hypothetical protein